MLLTNCLTRWDMTGIMNRGNLILVTNKLDSTLQHSKRHEIISFQVVMFYKLKFSHYQGITHFPFFKTTCVLKPRHVGLRLFSKTNSISWLLRLWKPFQCALIWLITSGDVLSAQRSLHRVVTSLLNLKSILANLLMRCWSCLKLFDYLVHSKPWCCNLKILQEKDDFNHVWYWNGLLAYWITRSSRAAMIFGSL